MMLKLAHHKTSGILPNTDAHAQDQTQTLLQVLTFPHEVLHTADVHVCCFRVLPLRAIQAVCLF